MMSSVAGVSCAVETEMEAWPFPKSLRLKKESFEHGRDTGVVSRKIDEIKLLVNDEWPIERML